MPTSKSSGVPSGKISFHHNPVRKGKPTATLMAPAIKLSRMPNRAILSGEKCRRSLTYWGDSAKRSSEKPITAINAPIKPPPGALCPRSSR
ncbi:Uncharacterised protein [Vibrio cholerae]|nr:Uncharacterised protein [Vibrio cholerae]CSB40006.1 Uncharacterised protein [Vibrio cholerae]